MFQDHIYESIWHNDLLQRDQIGAGLTQTLTNFFATSALKSHGIHFKQPTWHSVTHVVHRLCFFLFALVLTLSPPISQTANQWGTITNKTASPSHRSTEILKLGRPTCTEQTERRLIFFLYSSKLANEEAGETGLWPGQSLAPQSLTSLCGLNTNMKSM